MIDDAFESLWNGFLGAIAIMLVVLTLLALVVAVGGSLLAVGRMISGGDLAADYWLLRMVAVALATFTGGCGVIVLLACIVDEVM